MRNPLPKTLHPLAGWPLIRHVLEAAAELAPERSVLVLAEGMDEVAAVAASSALAPALALQDAPLGTGHALKAAHALLPDNGTVLVLFGDTPLLTPATLRRLVEARAQADAAIAVLSIRPRDPAGYGRLRQEAGMLVEIVEARHADADLLATAPCNAGVMAFAAEHLAELLDALPRREGSGEYYLTDTVALATARGWRCLALESEAEEGLGVNTQEQLAEVTALLQQRLRHRAMANGAILPAPETVHLAADSAIGAGALIEPYVVLGPGVRIGEGAVIHSFSHLERASVAARAEIGPFARLRPGSEIGEGAKIGNFVETKNTKLAPGAKASHLTYLGDAEVGAKANIGAGTITCNYDGFNKFPTRIGAGAFIGSNSSLVAPVSVGEAAIVAAGTVVTRDVPADGLAIARVRQDNKEHRAGMLREQQRARRRRPD